MKIQNINSVNFGKHHVTNTIEAGHKDFVSLDNNDKLAVIYDMLCEQKNTLRNLSNEQASRQKELKNNLKKLSLNQEKMHKSAMQAAIWMSAKNSPDTSDAISSRLYYGKKIDIVG